MRLEEFPELRELEGELLRAQLVYSKLGEPIERPKIDANTVAALNDLYARSKEFGIEPSDSNLADLMIVTECLKKACSELSGAVQQKKGLERLTNSPIFKKLGADTSRGFDSLVEVVVGKYADAIIDWYRDEGCIDNLYHLIYDIKETNAEDVEGFGTKEGEAGSNLMKGLTKVNANKYTGNNVFRLIDASKEDIQEHSLLTNKRVLIWFRDSMEEKCYFVVPGTNGFYYDDNGKVISRCRAGFFGGNSSNIAMQIVNNLYSKIKDELRVK